MVDRFVTIINDHLIEGAHHQLLLLLVLVLVSPCDILEWLPSATTANDALVVVIQMKHLHARSIGWLAGSLKFGVV